MKQWVFQRKALFFPHFVALLPPKAASSAFSGNWRIFLFNVCEILLIISVGFSSKVKKECFFFRSVYAAGTVVNKYLNNVQEILIDNYHDQYWGGEILSLKLQGESPVFFCLYIHWRWAGKAGCGTRFKVKQVDLALWPGFAFFLQLHGCACPHAFTVLQCSSKLLLMLVTSPGSG